MSPSSLAGGLEALADRLDQGSGDAGHVVLVAADLQVHPDALADLTEDPRRTTAALVSRRADPGDVRPADCADVRVRSGRVVAAGSTVHTVVRGDARFTGALRVADLDRPAAAVAARQAALLAGSSGWVGDPVDLLLVAVVRGGTPVGAVFLDPWPWRRGPGGTDAEGFEGTVVAIGPERSHALRLARATKTDDGAWATVVSRPLSRRLTPPALRRHLTPDQVTLASFVIGLAAAACFATGNRAALVAGAVLLQLSLVLDCVDGDIARYQRSFTATGAWLDASTDRLKEFACYGGLAFGADAGREGWLLAGVMLTVQTVRHTVDYTFTAVDELRESGARPHLPLDVLEDGPEPTGSRAVSASQLSNRRAGVKWTKRVLHLGIGERWAVLSVLAALGRPVTALVVLLVLAMVSLAYTSAGRTLRARAWSAAGSTQPSSREREVVAAQIDAAPLLAGLDRRMAAGSSRFLWARPALVRAVEYAAVLAVAWSLADGASTSSAAAFALLLAVAFHHYDGLYRVLNGLATGHGRHGPWRGLGLGWPGRVLVVVALGAFTTPDVDVLEGGLWVMAGALGMLFLVVEPVGVLRVARDV